MAKSFASFLADQSGATAVEYALLATLIAVFVVGVVAAIGTSLSSEFAEVSSAYK